MSASERQIWALVGLGLFVLLVNAGQWFTGVCVLVGIVAAVAVDWTEHR